MKEKENLHLDGVQGPKVIRARRAQVVAPLTATITQQSSWEVAALEFAKGKNTPAANLDVKEIRSTEARSKLNLDVYHTGSQPSLPTINKSQDAESFSYENAVHTPASTAGLWLGQKIHQGPVPNSKP
ncbi:hypothetical protein FRC00_011457, partial [Tulasnella sp. 408]